MYWLVDNPIGNMVGPHFLLFYGCTIVMTLAVCAWWVRSGDRSADRPLAELPKTVDPYHVAYLRGGVNEVTRLAIFELIERGYIEMLETKKGIRSGQELDRKEDHPSPDALSPPARTAFEWFSIARKPEEVFRNAALPRRMERPCEQLKAWAEQENLLVPAEMHRAGWMGLLTGAIVIFGLGSYKLAVALSKGLHNVGYLIVMGLVGLSILFAVARVSRLSRRGKQYLGQLQATFRRSQWGGSLSRAFAAGPSLLFSVGLFGVAAVAATQFAPFQKMFGRGASSGGCSGGYWGYWGGCSGGCGAGSSSGGGGGCSGGGGGCSGGGGGCGGGCGGCGGG